MSQCVVTRFSHFHEGVVRDQLSRFTTLLLWYSEMLETQRLPNIERRWWRKLITWYKVKQFQKVFDRCKALWNQLVDIDNRRHVVDLGNVHLVHMADILPHVRMLGYWGKEELENSIFHWSAIEECLQKTVISLE